MNCLEAQRLIRPFLYRKLSGRLTERFLDHVEHCPDCMEELGIYHTIMVALNENDDRKNERLGAITMNYQDMLQARIIEARSAIHWTRMRVIVRRMLIVTADLILLAVFAVQTGLLDAGPVKSQISLLWNHSANESGERKTAIETEECTEMIQETECVMQSGTETDREEIVRE